MARFCSLLGCAVLAVTIAAGRCAAHPGSGLFVDDEGTVTFVDTGAGVWQVDATGKRTLKSEQAWHWLAYDATGAFAEVDDLGKWFQRVTPRGERPALVACSDFPIAIGPDESLYFPLMHGLTIKRRTPGSEETVVAEPSDFGYSNTEDSDERGVGVNGIACGADGVVYIVILDDLHQSEASADHWLYAINPKAPRDRVRLVKKNFLPADQIIAADQRHHESIPQYCRGLAVDVGGNVFFAAVGNRCVVRVTPEGESTIVLRCEKPWSPTAVAVRDDDLYVLEYDDETPVPGREWPPRVRKLAADGEVTTIAEVTREATER
jgi:sugar lactone lactonase YvrE